MRTLLILAILWCGALVDYASASEFESSTGEVFIASEYSVSTRIDGRIAVTDIIETYSLATIGAAGTVLNLTLTSDVNRFGLVCAVSVGQSGTWVPASVEAHENNVSPADLGPRGLTHLSVPRRTLRVPVRLQLDGSGRIMTKISFTQVLTVQGGRLHYPVPRSVASASTLLKLKHLTVSVESPFPLDRVYSSGGDAAVVDRSGLHASMKRSWDQQAAGTAPEIIYVQCRDNQAYVGAAITGWHGDDEYAIFTPPAPLRTEGGTRQTRKIWIVLDDHFSGHGTYATFKRLYQESIDLLRPDDDYDVFQLTHSIFFGWRNFLTRYPESPLDAMAWAMQSNGYGAKSQLVRPAAWILDRPVEETQELDVIFLTHDVRGGLGAVVSESEIAQLQERRIRLYTIAQSVFPLDLRTLEDAARATGGTFTMAANFEDPQAVCRDLFAHLRTGESIVLDVPSASKGLADVVHWSVDGSRATSAAACAMRIQDRSKGWVALGGYQEGAPHTWSVEVMPSNAPTVSSVVPLIWADAFSRRLEQIRAEQRDVPSVSAELTDEIERVGLEFRIPTCATMYTVDMTSPEQRVP